MSKIGAYQPIEKYKNYLLPTSKPLRSHAFYEEKVWTLQEQIYKKLKKVAELLKSLYPKLTDDFSKNLKVVIEKNIKILIEDLDLMQQGLHENPDSFNTNELKINQHHITEMKNVCDTLQTVRSYEYESKNLGKIKHALHELEHLIQPTSFERSLEKTPVKSKQRTVPAKKEHILVEAKKKIEEDSIVKSKKQKAISKKTKPATKLPKQIKIESKQPKKSATPVHKLKPSEKKATKPKPKLPAEKILKAKPTSKPKLPAEKILKAKPTSKPKLPAEKILKAKPTSKMKSSAEHKKKLSP
jgi:hypothetical protein